MVTTLFTSFFFCLLALSILVLAQMPGPARTVVAIRFAETAEEDLKNFDETRPVIGGRLDVVA